MASQPAYEQRLILFLDILGFREIVHRTETDQGYLHKVLDAINVIKKIKADDQLHKTQMVTQFSDSIVVSYHIDEQSAVFWLLNQIGHALVELITKGFLVRGAITVGNLLHTDDYLIGPAMVRAYELESKTANFPRVIVDPVVIEVARNSRSDLHSPNDEERYVRSFLKKDADGWLYYNYMTWAGVVDGLGWENDGYPEYLYLLGKIVKEGLQHTDPRVAEKYLWLHAKYIEARGEFSNLPKSRRQDHEFCEAIESLNTYSGLADNAKQRIAIFKAQQAAGKKITASQNTSVLKNVAIAKKKASVKTKIAKSNKKYS